MNALVYQNLAALTVTYNGVQFGGGDADHPSTPPEYKLRGQFVYDDSGRAIIGTKYQMTVSTIFYQGSELSLAFEINDIREKLSAPAKELKIYGLGTNFDNIASGARSPIGGVFGGDSGFGPKPISFDWQPLGQIAWQCVWVVEFMITECVGTQSASDNPDIWMAFNFDTTWQNDFEGMCERTISGYVQIAPRRTGANLKTLLTTADTARNGLNIVVPENFRRVRNVWRENAAKDRMDFVVTDEAEKGDPLPPGCILADGDFSYDVPGPAFNRATCSLNMRLVVSPSFPPGLAGIIFLQIAKTKHNLIAGGDVFNNATPIIRGLSIRSGKFNRARETIASMHWSITGNRGSLMKAAGIWEPLRPDPSTLYTYPLWRASIENLWGNRGFHGLASNPAESVIVDLCDGVTSANIGTTSANRDPQYQQPEFFFNCPKIPEGGGWLAHDLRLTVLQQGQQTWHKKALAYLGGTIDAVTDDEGDRTGIGGPNYDQQGDAQEDDLEYHGYPDTYILLQFRATRLIRKPIMPELISVAGKPAIPVTDAVVDGPRFAFDSMTCPVWFLRGYRVYKVNGRVATVEPVTSKVSSAMPDTNLSNLYPK